MSFNPAVSGIGGATDVAISSKQDNQVLTYGGTVDKWRNEAPTGGGATNLALTRSATNVVITSDTGTDATIAAATETNAGVLTPETLLRIDDVEAAVDGIATVPVSSFSGRLNYEQLPTGMVLFVACTSANAVSINRPTARTDLQVRWRGPASSPPAAMVAGVDVIDDTGA